jgi:hypothetical protein
MLSHKIYSVFSKIVGFPLMLLVPIFTLVLGILVSLTFGLLLLPLSLIWIVLIGPLYGLSFLGSKNELLRNLIGFFAIPLVIVAEIYASLCPSMGERESRLQKLLFCWTWPYSYEFTKFDVLDYWEMKVQGDIHSRNFGFLQELCTNDGIDQHLRELAESKHNSISL